uniref:Cathepsin propeptide inhibitor domain-containing protein n=1 Tax=Oryza rufipogon TaxID=4529 RepID=A0A0E0P306_ORYRU
MSTAALVAWLARDVSTARAAAHLAAAAASRAARSSAVASRPCARSAAVAARRAARQAAVAASRAAHAVCYLDDYEPSDDGPDPGAFLTDFDESGDDFTDKDFESDEAIWALYERWCKAYDKKRDLAEMTHRFKIFKQNAEALHRSNEGASKYEKIYCGPYCDGFDEQERAEALLKFRHFPRVCEYIESLEIVFPKSREVDSPNQSP